MAEEESTEKEEVSQKKEEPLIVSSEIINEVPVKLTAVLGSTVLPIGHILKFRRGSVIELNRKVSEPIALYVNDRIIARGEIVVVEGSVGINLTEIASQNGEVMGSKD